jgi:hypothetical protein
LPTLKKPAGILHKTPQTDGIKKDAPPTEPGGTLAFQRLRNPLFTPPIKPCFKFERTDKLSAIGSCFARQIEQALLRRKMEVLSAAPEFASLQTINQDVTGLV